MNDIKLNEAANGDVIHTVTQEERQLKSRVRNMLREQGYNGYANRLEKFSFNIFPTDSKLVGTAAMFFDQLLIGVNRGFINDEKTFFQLSVLIRHELLHALLMHQIRMTDKLGEPRWMRLHYSALMAEIENVVADFEVSEHYTEADKKTVRRMRLNGEIIGGLVVEDHRDAWKKLTIEQMYDNILIETAAAHKKLLAMRSDSGAQIDKDIVNSVLLRPENNTFIYNNIDAPTSISRPLDVFIAKNRAFASYAPQFKDIVINLQTALVKDPKYSYSDNDIMGFVKQIASSNVVKDVSLIDKGTKKEIINLITPEEKMMAINVLKRIIADRHLYDEWFKKVKEVLSAKNYSDTDLQQILAEITK